MPITPPDIADMSAGEDAKRGALQDVDSILKSRGLMPEPRVSVLMLAAVLAIRDLMKGSEGSRAKRGKIINAACEDFKNKLQRFL